MRRAVCYYHLSSVLLAHPSTIYVSNLSTPGRWQFSVRFLLHFLYVIVFIVVNAHLYLADRLCGKMGLHHITELRSLDIDLHGLFQLNAFQAIHLLLTRISPHQMEHLFIAFHFRSSVKWPEDAVIAFARLIGESQFAALREVKFRLQNVGKEPVDFRAWVRKWFSVHAEAGRICFL
jgi:hypothetical protein